MCSAGRCEARETPEPDTHIRAVVRSAGNGRKTGASKLVRGALRGGLPGQRAVGSEREDRSRGAATKRRESGWWVEAVFHSKSNWTRPVARLAIAGSACGFECASVKLAALANRTTREPI